MKNAFVRGAILGVVASTVIMESDMNYKSMMKKGKKLIKKKIDDLIDR